MNIEPPVALNLALDPTQPVDLATLALDLQTDRYFTGRCLKVLCI